MNNQLWNPEKYSEIASFVPHYGLPLIDILAPQSYERILDIGCGDGLLSLSIQKYGSRVIGVDSSPTMIASARDKGVDAYVMSAENLNYKNEFDGVFSNAALHWIKNPKAVLAGVNNALKVNGRFIAEFGGQGNIASIVVAIKAALREFKIDVPSQKVIPWYFPSIDEYSRLLIENGFSIKYIETVPRLTPIAYSFRQWFEVFGGGILQYFGDQRENVINYMEELLMNVLTDGKQNWILDYVRLRLIAIKQ